MNFTKKNKSILFLLPFVLPTFFNAQVQQDSARYIHYSWRSFALHTGTGVQRSVYLEIGPSFVAHAFDSKEGFGNGILYSAFEWTPIKNIYGIKLGGELGSNLSMLCVEAKYQYTNEVTDFVITPKLGLGFGTINIYYGYNFSTSKYPFSSVGKHQFSLVFNLTPKFLRYPKKTE